MTLVSEIIRDAYRESNLIAINSEPSAAQEDEGLRLLKRLVSSVYGFEAGEKFQSLPIGRRGISRPSGYPGYETVPDADWFVPSNTRLSINLEEATTVYLDPRPNDGARFAILDKSDNLSDYPLTIDANGQTITGDATLTVVEDGANREYFYRQDTGDWTLVSPLEASDTFPFPTEFDDLFVTGLAIRLNPRHTVEADPQTISAYQRSLRQFKARYKQSREVWSEMGLWRTLGVRYLYRLGSLYNPNDAFNHGNPPW